MYPKRCGECGEEIVVSRDPLRSEFRGETVMVHGVEHGTCSGCGETFLPLGAMEQLQKEASAEYRRRRGLLTPDEILQLRASLRMSQPAFESLLGVGPKTVIRWEKGTVVQSAIADRFMFVLREMPQVVDLLLNGHRTSGQFRTPLPGQGVRMKDAEWHHQEEQPELSLDHDLIAHECHSLAA